MIEYDESEYLFSPLKDETLIAVLLLCGQDVKDRLLYKKEDAACMISSSDYSKAL